MWPGAVHTDETLYGSCGRARKQMLVFLSWNEVNCNRKAVDVHRTPHMFDVIVNNGVNTSTRNPMSMYDMWLLGGCQHGRSMFGVG